MDFQAIENFHNTKLIYDDYFYGLYTFLFEMKNKYDYTLNLIKLKRNKYTILLFDSSDEKVYSGKSSNIYLKDYASVRFWRNRSKKEYNKYLLEKIMIYH